MTGFVTRGSRTIPGRSSGSPRDSLGNISPDGVARKSNPLAPLDARDRAALLVARLPEWILSTDLLRFV
jgi:hypothetical protein